MLLENALTRRLGVTLPIVQAPMAGGATTVDLVAAVSDAGALGFLGAAYLTATQITEISRQLRSRTSRPFGINLFAPLPPPGSPGDAQAALERLAPIHADLGLPVPVLPTPATVSFAEQLGAVLGSGASVFSFTFGLPPARALRTVKDHGMFAIGTATTVEEAIALEAAGVDAVVAQGSEAGGHRGTFAGAFEAAMVGTMALVPQMADAIRVPVIASGGIMDGRGIAAALALGAEAVQLGTAFLTCDEAGVADMHKQAILDAHEDATRVTRAFSGRPARGIVNRFIEQIEGREARNAILPYPQQNALTRPARMAAAEQGRSEYLSLWAGQGVRLARRQSAAELVATLADETAVAIRRLAAPGEQ